MHFATCTTHILLLCLLLLQIAIIQNCGPMSKIHISEVLIGSYMGVEPGNFTNDVMQLQDIRVREVL